MTTPAGHLVRFLQVEPDLDPEYHRLMLEWIHSVEERVDLLVAIDRRKKELLDMIPVRAAAGPGGG